MPKYTLIIIIIIAETCVEPFISVKAPSASPIPHQRIPDPR